MTSLPITYAVVPAAGCGHRFGGAVKKQFLPLADKEVLIHTLAMLASVPAIRGIFVMTDAADAAHCTRLLEQYSLTSLCQVCPGGSTRQESVYLGLQRLPSSCSVVVIHDAARPLAPASLIEESIRTADDCGGAVAAVPVKDTIKLAEPDGTILETPPRSLLWSAQTPQTFRAAPLRLAYDKAWAAGDFSLTDDSQVMEKYGTLPIRLIPGCYENIKITTPEDLPLAETILKNRSQLL